MKIGYARVSTRDQHLDLQADALKLAGCERIYQDVASGSMAARPGLDELLGQLRAGDVLVIWKLDRLGRSLKHLVALVGELVRRDVGLLSLNDPVDTTSAQGRLVFNLFASLAEFEREVIAERTKAGLSAARARGRRGGRPAGLSSQAEATAMVAQTLYLERRLSVAAIARKLHISKSTLYRYLRHRSVQVSMHKKAAAAGASGSAQADLSEGVQEDASTRKATILLWLRVENNNKHVRGKKRALENIQRYCLPPYEALRRSSGEYALQVPYCSDAALDQIVSDLLEDIAREADMCNCFSESNAQLEGTDRCW